MDKPIMAFKSHIGGRNADVEIHADRIEWAQERRNSLGMKRTTGSEAIPMRSVSSVTTKRDGLRFTKVCVITSGNTVDFRVGHGEADGIKQTIMSLITGSHVPQPVVVHHAPAPAPPVSAGPPPGWYNDPKGAPLQRWWDGSQWTDHTQGAAAPPPVPG